MYLEGPEGGNALITSDEPAALMIRRVEFDALLVNLARDAGAEVLAPFDIVQASECSDGIELTARDGRSIRAPVVIAADGVHSVVARRLGMNRGWPPGSVALDMMGRRRRATACGISIRRRCGSRMVTAVPPGKLWPRAMVTFQSAIT